MFAVPVIKGKPTKLDSKIINDVVLDIVESSISILKVPVRSSIVTI